MPLTLKKERKPVQRCGGLTSFYLCWVLECQDRDEYRRQESSSEEIVLIWLKVTFWGWRDASAGKTLEDQNSDPQNHGKVKWASRLSCNLNVGGEDGTLERAAHLARRASSGFNEKCYLYM